MPSYENLLEFISEDAQEILDGWISYYQGLSNKILLPAQAETLLIKTCAYREQLMRSGVNYTGRQNMLRYSAAPMLDYLGELLDVIRLPAQSAEAQIRFTIVAGVIGTVTVPAGLRVQSTDGKQVFSVKEDIVVPEGVLFADAICYSLNTGVDANGYAIGSISNILDPEAFITAASNLKESDGGASQESDDQLRDRIRLAPNKFSTAGAKDAYIYWAKSAHPSIVDVEVKSLTPGSVTVWPLVLGGGATPAPVLAAVDEVLNRDNILPLNDLVIVTSPTEITNTLSVELVVFNSADDTQVTNAVTSALTDFKNTRKAKLGIDATKSKVSSVAFSASPDGIYSCTVIHPSSDVAVDVNEYVNFTSVTVTIVGHTNG